ncbi:glycosyltransferase [Cryobacterium sp. TMT2-14]|uniref:glycosyltransferase family 2 protein n=1 Tax=Cryobacterium sp. TMT2-14 TaxID=1259245 RepID=UPI00106AB52E|nr:glycosyltransferase [Cryobacterium sp. TMT2-14]TFC36368.1 glycosyltransferase [Cryobacterium sp. TMT2-14]
MPRLSVILPVRNGERTIARAVTSTCRALPADAELVIFDDGSTDSTPTLLRSFESASVRVITSPVSVGVATALNMLIDRTDSEFIARMDADDVTLTGRFGYQRRAISPGAAVNFTTVLEWRPDSRRVSPAAPLPISARAFPYHLLMTNPVSHPTLFAKRAALVRVGGYRQVPAEDYDLWLRLASEGIGIRRLAIPTLLYRMHPQQVTSSLEWRHASWTDRTVAAAFGRLSDMLLGRPFSRLVSLGFDATVGPQEVERTLADFAARLESAIADLPPWDRRILMRRLAGRCEAVRAMGRTDESGATVPQP